MNAGLKITLTDRRGDETKQAVMVYDGGVRSFVEHLNRNKTPLFDDVIYIWGKKGDSIAEIAMQYNDGYTRP